MKTLTITAASLLALLSSSNVAAVNDHTGFYVGGSLGKAKLKNDGVSTSGTGFGAYGGYNFNHWFGLEANFFGSGDLDDKNVDISAVSFTLTPKFTYQINDTFSIYGKFGYAASSATLSVANIDLDYTGNGWTYGVGVNASVTKNLNIRLGYDMIKTDLEADNFAAKVLTGNKKIDTDISNFALGMHYQF